MESPTAHMYLGALLAACADADSLSPGSSRYEGLSACAASSPPQSPSRYGQCALRAATAPGAVPPSGSPLPELSGAVLMQPRSPLHKGRLYRSQFSSAARCAKLLRDRIRWSCEGVLGPLPAPPPAGAGGSEGRDRGAAWRQPGRVGAARERLAQLLSEHARELTADWARSTRRAARQLETDLATMDHVAQLHARTSDDAVQERTAAHRQLRYEWARQRGERPSTLPPEPRQLGERPSPGALRRSLAGASSLGAGGRCRIGAPSPEMNSRFTVTSSSFRDDPDAPSLAPRRHPGLAESMPPPRSRPMFIHATLSLSGPRSPPPPPQSAEAGAGRRLPAPVALRKHGTSSIPTALPLYSSRVPPGAAQVGWQEICRRRKRQPASVRRKPPGEGERLPEAPHPLHTLGADSPDRP
eukprot:TRINITY_DN16745_c1_g1_i1.p1 TRINITY_DN16745_c1_g1~~TRINITY_DN16745_c1_g1_i1.p1  ORF type:complete len:441 (+),score=96.83 TRINITY_DN16745_c1_g1_i1:87-1325(+)